MAKIFVSRIAIPRHALHGKGLQRHKGVGPLVSSREERAILFLLINRGWNARQPWILFQHSVCIGFCLFVLLERRSSDVPSMLWRVRETLVSWVNSSVRPRPVAPPCASTRSIRGMSGFWTRQIVLIKARISTAKRIPGICGEQRNSLIWVGRKCVGSAPVFLSPEGGIEGFRDQGKLVRKISKMHR